MNYIFCATPKKGVYVLDSSESSTSHREDLCGGLLKAQRSEAEHLLNMNKKERAVVSSVMKTIEERIKQFRDGDITTVNVAINKEELDSMRSMVSIYNKVKVLYGAMHNQRQSRCFCMFMAFMMLVVFSFSLFFFPVITKKHGATVPFFAAMAFTFVTIFTYVVFISARICRTVIQENRIGELLYENSRLDINKLVRRLRFSHREGDKCFYYIKMKKRSQANGVNADISISERKSDGDDIKRNAVNADISVSERESDGDDFKRNGVNADISISERKSDGDDIKRNAIDAGISVSERESDGDDIEDRDASNADTLRFCSEYK